MDTKIQAYIWNAKVNGKMERFHGTGDKCIEQWMTINDLYSEYTYVEVKDHIETEGYMVVMAGGYGTPMYTTHIFLERA